MGSRVSFLASAADAGYLMRGGLVKSKTTPDHQTAVQVTPRATG